MTAELLPCVEQETGPRPTAAVIWLHGLGADGNDFVPIVGEMRLPASLPIRFVFPHAPGAAGHAQQRVPDAGLVRPVGGGHHQSRRCRRSAGVAGARRGARRAGKGAWHRSAADRHRRILARRRHRAAHWRSPRRAAGGHRRAVDVRRAAGKARGGGECGQSRRADLHGARNVRSDGPPGMGRGRAAGARPLQAIASTGIPTRCRIRSSGKRSRR